MCRALLVWLGASGDGGCFVEESRLTNDSAIIVFKPAIAS